MSADLSPNPVWRREKLPGTAKHSNARWVRSNMCRKSELLEHLSHLHTTELGVQRIRKNIAAWIDVEDVVAWCKGNMQDTNSIMIRRGKNWYVSNQEYVITVNAYSFTIITVHPTEARKSGT